MIARRRAQWRKYQGRIDPRHLVFIDETWAKTNMTRLRGWCARGLPLVDKIPHGHWRTLTFLAALRHDRIDAPLVLDAPINGESFAAYVKQFLLPTLSSGDIVAMDNLGSPRARPCDSSSAPSAPGSSFCRPTRPTSTQSSRSLPSSRPCSARPTPDRSRRHGSRFVHSSRPPHLTNAPTTSATADTLLFRADSDQSGS